VISLVKVCGLTDRAAVDAAVAAGANAIGFVFAESVRRVTPERAAELSAGVPDSVRRVAVMLHPSEAEWQAVYATFRPDVLQSDADDFESLQVSDEVECWPVIREGSIDDIAVFPKTFLYEGRASGQGQTVNWEQASACAKLGHMILAGGLSADNVADAIREVSPWGVDVSSAVESAPGRKDPNKIAAFVEAARSAK